MCHKIADSLSTARKPLVCLASLVIAFSLGLLLIQAIQAASEPSQPIAPAHMPPSTYVGGDITEDTVWTLAGSPYVVTSTVRVNNGVTLTVQAGVEVLFDNQTGLWVQGALRALGTATQPITFTTSAATPAPYQWEGIFFQADSDDARNELAYVTVSYGGHCVTWNGLCVSIAVYDASPTIRPAASDMMATCSTTSTTPPGACSG